VTEPSRRERVFLELVERHAGILAKVSRVYCPIAAQRPDLVQEITLALWRSFDRYDSTRPFATWMYRIAINVAISFFRSESRRALREAQLELTDRPADVETGDVRVDRLLDCIEELGSLDKALVLLYLDGYAHAEIAQMLGITPSNAGTKLARIKERLRRAMTTTQIERKV
jgi:RNA polymerase sigma-70 factor (ECF subfamily)